MVHVGDTVSEIPFTFKSGYRSYIFVKPVARLIVGEMIWRNKRTATCWRTL
jgi:hypothetical protein